MDNGPGFPNTIRQGALGLKLSGTRATSYNELFNLNIRINRYNRQNADPESSGAVVTIEMMSINDISMDKASVG
jgi:hypothetical protein